MKTFIVPVDFSAVTDHVVDTAVSLARSLDGKIALVHIIQPPVVTSEYGLPVEALQDAIMISEQAATKHLARLGERVAKEGVKFETILRHGPPVSGILEEADKAQADFIVIGSHGHGKLYDLLVGTTAFGLLKRAKCAVVILPPEAKPAPKPVLP
ncbi:MAG: universal stress protein [Opitutaceae bacterium]|nr:universal stress protein [Opitutaceae bacterium]